MVLSPQSEAALALWAQGPRVTDPSFGPDDIAERRRLDREAAAEEPVEPVAHVQDVDAYGVPCRLYLPQGAAGVVVFVHGGGFVFGDLDTHDPQSRRLANRTGLAVLSVDYRRPPEHRFPTAPEDVDTAVSWLVVNGPVLGLDIGRIVALGDSAGGNLALVAARRNPNVFAATVLVYPFLDPRARFSSYRHEDGGLGADEAAWYWHQYAGSADDLRNPDLAPLEAADLGRLPPTWVLVAEHDVLLDEGVELARRLEAAGVETELVTYPGMVHGFWRHPSMFDDAEQSLAEIADFVRRRV